MCLCALAAFNDSTNLTSVSCMFCDVYVSDTVQQHST